MHTYREHGSGFSMEGSPPTVRADLNAPTAVLGGAILQGAPSFLGEILSLPIIKLLMALFLKATLFRSPHVSYSLAFGQGVPI